MRSGALNAGLMKQIIVDMMHRMYNVKIIKPRSLSAVTVMWKIQGPNYRVRTAGGMVSSIDIQQRYRPLYGEQFGNKIYFLYMLLCLSRIYTLVQF